MLQRVPYIGAAVAVLILLLLLPDCSQPMPLVKKTGLGDPILVYGIGDSRMAGAGTTDPATKNWLKLSTNRLPPYYQVTNAGVNGLSLFTTSGTPSKIAATTATVQAVIGSASQSGIIVQIDINDWSNNVLAATWGGWLADQLDSFHANIPNASIDIFTSLDYQTYGTANSQGSTMQDYLAQQNAVVAARLYSRIVLGKPMLTWVASPAPSATQPQGFFDDKHPNDIGNIVIANNYAPLFTGF